MGTHGPIVYFGPDPWVLILSRTQPVEPVDSVAAYSYSDSWFDSLRVA
jgi:hypothetical protein